MFSTTVADRQVRWPTMGEPRSMTGRGLRRSDGPRCCRFLASAPLAQKPAQDSPDQREASGGPIRAERASDSLKPSAAHLATKARYAPVGDRAGTGLGK